LRLSGTARSLARGPRGPFAAGDPGTEPGPADLPRRGPAAGRGHARGGGGPGRGAPRARGPGPGPAGRPRRPRGTAGAFLRPGLARAIPFCDTWGRARCSIRRVLLPPRCPNQETLMDRIPRRARPSRSLLGIVMSLAALAATAGTSNDAAAAERRPNV